MILSALIAACAPQVAPETVNAIIRVESRGDANAIHVNGIGYVPVKDRADAAAKATKAIAQGYSVDVGLMQVNSVTARIQGLGIEQLLDPCTNLAAGAKVITANYANAVKRHGKGQPALQAALSAYNTGNERDGFRNGYVARYYPAMRVAYGGTSPYTAPSSVFVAPAPRRAD